jgi:predicted transcriptional regulator
LLHSTFPNTRAEHQQEFDALTEEADRRNADLMGLTADIVAAFVQNNAVPVAGLPDLISSVNAALSGLDKPAAVEQPMQKPAVNPKRSVFPDYIVSLEDGKQYRTLKRHLARHGMTPEEYRAKWSLAADYPTVAPSYSATRSALAKSLGLGRKPAAPVKKTATRRKAEG